MSEPITFERDGFTYGLLAGSTTKAEDGRRYVYLWEKHYATEDDLRAAGFVRVPSMKELAKILRESDEKFRHKYTSTADGVYVTRTPDIRLQWLTRAILRALGVQS